ncbi:hypothetical protein NQ315_009458 [Exocentrus adspersus]|uniref:Cytochrome P450 n=1 Tax=Exocentrus adspersus TaxID=1586481 RepID=A0AAV8WG59_9CUCU|nr:hypothetical protein NQ315_009458 [Exocentrus adspersus]
MFTFSSRGLMLQVLKMFTTIYRWKWFFNMMPISKEVNKYQNYINEFSDSLLSDTETYLNVKASNQVNDFEEDKKISSLLNYLPKAKDANAPLSREELRDETTTFMIAVSMFAVFRGNRYQHSHHGFCTNSPKLVSAHTGTRNIGSNPSGSCHPYFTLILFSRKKVYDEIMEVIGPIKDVENADLPKLKYTEMVIKEALRYFTPVGYVFKRADADMTLGSTFIPSGSNFMISLVSIHHNPKYWPDPMTFNPERFHSDNVIKPYTFVPFSAGSRACPGDRFAMMFVKTILATVIRKYEVFTDYKSLQDIELSYDFASSARNGYKIRLRHRNN